MKISVISSILPPAASSAAESERSDTPASISSEPEGPDIYVLFPVEPLKSGQILDIYNLLKKADRKNGPLDSV